MHVNAHFVRIFKKQSFKNNMIFFTAEYIKGNSEKKTYLKNTSVSSLCTDYQKTHMNFSKPQSFIHYSL